MSAPPDPWRAIDELWTEVEAIKARLGPGVGVVRLPATGYALRDLVRDAIVQALQMSDWRQTDAAALLHVSPRLLSYRIRALGIRMETKNPNEVRALMYSGATCGQFGPVAQGTSPRQETRHGLRDSAHRHARDPAADDGEPAADGVG